MESFVEAKLYFPNAVANAFGLRRKCYRVDVNVIRYDYIYVRSKGDKMARLI